MAMEWNPETLQFLSQCFLNSLSPLADLRRGAEAALAETADRPNYALAILWLVAEPAVDEQIRQSAAVNLKNYLKALWAQQPMPESEKEQIKGLIVRLMVTAPPKIRAMLGEGLIIIGAHDFPRRWPDLLPEIVANLDRLSQVNDYDSVNGFLSAINSLFKKFRYDRTSIRLMSCCSI